MGIVERYEKGWRRGVERVTNSLALLSAAQLEELARLAGGLVERKRLMQELVLEVDGGKECAGCLGACCVAGRYHFSAVDLLVYRIFGEPLFTPLFGNGLCPYLAEEGCLMPPHFRPFNCITFNCERIEGLLDAASVTRFYSLERELRELYRAVRALFPNREADGAVLNLESD